MIYRQLVVWQKAMQLAEEIYRRTSQFPIEERYGLRAQMRRAAVSIPSNIAEGQARRSSDADFVRFLQVASGSLGELVTQIELSLRLGMLESQVADDLRPRAAEVGRMLAGLIRAKKR